MGFTEAQPAVLAGMEARSVSEGRGIGEICTLLFTTRLFVKITTPTGGPPHIAEMAIASTTGKLRMRFQTGRDVQGPPVKGVAEL